AQVRAQIEALRAEVVKAREDAKEVSPGLEQRIDRLYAEMETMKKEVPPELKSLAQEINSVNNTMDGIQKELRYGGAAKEKMEALAAGVNRLYGMVTDLTKDAGETQLLLVRVNKLEDALEKAGGLSGKELKSTVGAIKAELDSLEKEVGSAKTGQKSLSKEVEAAQSAIQRLEKKTRDELHAQLGDLKKQLASTSDVNAAQEALGALEHRVKEPGLEPVHERVSLAKAAADEGDVERASSIVKDMPVPTHVVAKVTVGGLEELEKQLAEADEDYSGFLAKVRELRDDYATKGLTKELQEDLGYLEEDLLDFWLDKRGLAEALSQAKGGDLEAARHLLDYERAALEDLKLDINSLRRRAASLPHAAVEQAELAIQRREGVEKELSAFAELKESLAGMKRERELLHKEVRAAKAHSTTAVVPGRVQESLDVAKKRMTPAVGREVERLEKDLQDKHVVPITEKNVEAARAKIGELAGKARQIEFGTGDASVGVARERLESARGKLGEVVSSSESVKQMALMEELNRSSGEIKLEELSSRTGIPVADIERILPSIGSYSVSNGIVAKAKAF
ncbi:hypothetical protein ACFLQ2_04490, partial [archaeon]